ncbi:MAG: hypothetical protein ACYTG7_05740, partial [Planctomycetota bacterium]
MSSAYGEPVNPPKIGIDLKSLVDELDPWAVDEDFDGDGLKDSIELVIGSDPENTDSDFDELDDGWEVENDLDPLEPDSNGDDLADYYEVTDIPLDYDNDGLPNAWDFDNDEDGVNDGVDLCPFFVTESGDQFHFEISSQGNSVYITFQIKPETEEHLRAFGQYWDWPDNDHEGNMQDRDGSKDDVTIFPFLELYVNIPPEASSVEPYGITVDENNVTVPLLPVYEHGTVVAFTGRMLYPHTSPSLITMDAKLVWKVVGKNDPEPGILGEDTLLAIYYEDFLLTGMGVEENHSTKAGLCYSLDFNQTVAANLLLAYKFLRMHDGSVDNMAQELNDAGVTATCAPVCESTHRDDVLTQLADELMPAALDTLPEDTPVPLVTLLESESEYLDITEFTEHSWNSFSVDLTGEDTRTSKILKTPWYISSSGEYEPLLTEEIMAAIDGLEELKDNDDASYSLMSLMLYWNTG